MAIRDVVRFSLFFFYCIDLVCVCFLGLSGVDLLMSDLKALEAYATYYYHLSKMWSKPLPEAYDPQDVAQYFSLRPHVVGLRVLEVLVLPFEYKHELILFNLPIFHFRSQTIGLTCEILPAF